MLKIEHPHDITTLTLTLSRDGALALTCKDNGSVPGYTRKTEGLGFLLSKEEAAQLAAALTEYAQK
jgi:hypothetical protein